MTEACAFCAIAAGTAPAAVAYDDGTRLAFADHRPIRPGHMQIVPHRHVETFEAMPPALAAQVIWLGQRIAQASKRLYGVARVGFVFSGNDAAHVHAHLVPLHAPTDITSGQYVTAGPVPPLANARRATAAEMTAAAEALAAELTPA